jgi:hypothetical protein
MPVRKDRPNTWQRAVAVYLRNGSHNGIPKRGTAEHAKLKSIHNKIKR